MIPDKTEINLLDNIVSRFLEKLKVKNAEIVVGGSYAKGTWLSGNKDVDVFVRFKDDKNISDKLEKSLKKLKVKRVHGSRDYFHVKFEGILFEIVPVLNVKKVDEAENITDASPLHVKYVNKKLNKGKKNEVRKLKQFLKANELYGAESYIRGFSGYVCELLIINYGSFDNLIKQVRRWRDNAYVDIENYYKNKKEGISSINYSKRGPLMLIDPIDRNRNAGAAISKEVYDKFRNLCRKYDGSESFFIPKKVDFSKLRGYIIYNAKPLIGKRDVVGSKLLKAMRYIEVEFLKHHYIVKDKGWSWDKNVHFWFKLDKVEKHIGPEVKMKKHAEAFKKKWRSNLIGVENGRHYALLKHKSEKAVAKKVLNSEKVLEKVKEIKLL